MNPRRLHSSLRVTREIARRLERCLACGRTLAAHRIADNHYLPCDTLAELHQAQESAARSTTGDPAQMQALAQRGDHGLIEC